MLGTVIALYRYPVKSLRGERLERAAVEAGGFAGDRARALIVRSPEHARSGKTYRGKEQRLLHTLAAATDARALAHATGLHIEDEGERQHYFDLEPVSIVFDAWLRELEALAGRPVEALRFRPNIVAAAAPAFGLSESALVGARLAIGSSALDVIAPITRCVTPSYDLVTGEPDRALQATIVAQRGNLMGVYCRVATPGTIDRGAAIALA